MVTSATGRGVAPERWFFDDFDAAVDTVPLVAPYRARVSATATLSLILGVVAVGAALTGLLAAAGVAVGIIAAVVGLPGLVGPRRHDRTGRSLALLGLVCGVGAATLGLLAIGDHLSWLSSRSDEVGQVHDWLTAELPWLSR